MIIGIALSQNAYTPEAFAYERHLSSNGHQVYLLSPNEVRSDLDISIDFCGICTKKPRGEKTLKIHEYSSLSTPPFAVGKNRLKRLISEMPAGRIFLNDFVKHELGFMDSVPYLLRDMGVDRELFAKPPTHPDFDLLYCGSTAGRAGLEKELDRLARLGLKILIVGDTREEFRNKFKGNSKIEFSGRLSRAELPSVFRRARSGLNFTPDIYPFNKQTSTKVIEYCAAGLGVVTNRYNWVESFAKDRNGNFLWLEDLTTREEFDSFLFCETGVEHLEWNSLLANAKLIPFLESVATGAGGTN